MTTTAEPSVYGTTFVPYIGKHRTPADPHGLDPATPGEVADALSELLTCYIEHQVAAVGYAPMIGDGTALDTLHALAAVVSGSWGTEEGALEWVDGILAGPEVRQWCETPTPCRDIGI